MTPFGFFTSCDVRIDAITMDDAVELLLNGKAVGAVHLCNAYTLSLVSHNSGLASALGRGSLNLPDGKPLIWIARRLGFTHMTRRVYGPELMQRTIEAGQSAGTRHYLYGSTPDVLERLQTHIASTWPDAVLAGAESPPFGEFSGPQLDEVASRFDAVRADIVWVGLGKPKQDLVTDELARRSSATYIAIGAAFDFLAGTKQQAPKWIREHGLEWAFRFATEPRRLWKRYLVGNSVFIFRNLRTRPRRSETTRDPTLG